MNTPTAAPGAKNVPDSAKRVVILGALSAIAMATARRYAAEGAVLYLVGRHLERLEQVAADLRTRGSPRVEVAAMDLEEGSEYALGLLGGWTSQIGPIDHVVLFYGYLGDQEKSWTDSEELSRILKVNFTSAALWCGAADEVMKRKKSGSVVAVGSVAGDRGRQSNFAYGSAKGGLAIFMQGLAHAPAPIGARAVVVKPGFVDTPMTAGMKKGGAMWATPDQVAKAIRRAADKGGPIQYAPGKWKLVMLVIRSVPSFIFHKTKL